LVFKPFLYQNLLAIKYSQPALAAKLEPELSSILDKQKNPSAHVTRPLSKMNLEYASALRDAGYTVNENHVFEGGYGSATIFLPNEKVCLEVMSRARMSKGTIAVKRMAVIKKALNDVDTVMIQGSFIRSFKYHKDRLINAMKEIIDDKKDPNEVFREQVMFVSEIRSKEREERMNQSPRGGATEEKAEETPAETEENTTEAEENTAETEEATEQTEADDQAETPEKASEPKQDN
jgi:ribosomal protein S8